MINHLLAHSPTLIDGDHTVWVMGRRRTAHIRRLRDDFESKLSVINGHLNDRPISELLGHADAGALSPSKVPYAPLRNGFHAFFVIVGSLQMELLIAFAIRRLLHRVRQAVPHLLA